MGLAGAGRAQQDDVLAAVQEVELAEVLGDLSSAGRMKSNSSRVLRAGNRAALIRFSPPWLSREATSVESTASRNFSCDQLSSRARSARFGTALAAAGAFRARKRWASSGWKCSGEAKARAGSKLERRKRWLRSRMPLDSGSAASQIDHPTGRAPQNATKASVGFPLGARSPPRGPCQFDLWEPKAEIPVGHGQTRRAWVVTCALGYSRAGAGALIFAKQAPDILWGMGRCLLKLGALFPGR